MDPRASAQPEDAVVEQSLRPPSFGEFVGQVKLLENLRIYVTAAKMRNTSLDHVLFSGPPGLGKTSLAHIIAAELGRGIKTTSGPAIEKQGDLAAVLTGLSEGDVLFIDEIHRLPRAIEEILYPAMEDGFIDIVIGQGISSKSIKLNLPPFTLIGATTRSGLLSAPLRDRFGILSHLELYTPQELVAIAKRSAAILMVSLDEEGALEIGKRSRGTPRIANRLLRRLRDYALVIGTGVVTFDIVQRGLGMMDIDDHGFDAVDRRILTLLIDYFDGGPVGVETLATAINEERDTIEDVYEPFLIQSGFIKRTARGRVALPRAYEYLGKTPRNAQQELF